MSVVERQAQNQVCWIIKHPKYDCLWLKVLQTSSVWKEDSRRKPGSKLGFLKVSTQMIQWLQITEIKNKACVVWPLVESSVKYRQFTVLLSPCFKEDFLSAERAASLPQNCHFADPQKIQKMCSSYKSCVYTQ